jgi:hypothetical protein
MRRFKSPMAKKECTFHEHGRNEGKGKRERRGRNKGTGTGWNDSLIRNAMI